jgi:diguanylate cyclase (GGDEF)-like protein
VKERLSDADELAERWSAAAALSASPAVLRGGEIWARFGEIPAFLATLAHQLEAVAQSSDGALADTMGDEQLRSAATELARKRAEAGYSQRDILAEFVALRRVLWEHFAEGGADERPTFAGERIVNLLLDSFIVEAADRFFTELTEALVRRAERDQLTDLYNRQTFHDKLGRELTRARRYGHQLTVVVIDLDAFKRVNDTLGHLAGDAVLKRVATLLSTHTRDEDIVGRLGGDEFAVALVETGMSAARDLIRRLRIHLAPAKRQFDLPQEFGVSFGAAAFPTQGDTVEKLLFAADTGLYHAKGPGRGERMEEAGHAPTLGKLRVLVADDDPGIRLLCSTALEREGFDVVEAPDGEQALTSALAQPPDVLLLDLTMPYRDGWEVVEELGRHEETRNVPVVMMTSSSSQENLDRVVGVVAIDFVSKPFAPEELVSRVHEVLEFVQQAEVAPA